MPFWWEITVHRSLFLAATLLGTQVHAQDWAPGEQIEEALALQITRSGFESAAGLVSVLIPGNIALDTVKMSTSCGFVDCYAIEFRDAWVGIQITDARLTPGNGVIDLDMDLLVQINESSDRFDLYIEILGIGDTCHGWVEPFPVNAMTTIAMQIVTNSDGTKSVDAIVGSLQVAHSLTGDDINLESCAIGTLEEVLNFFGLSLYDLVIGQLDSVLNDAIQDAVPDLEAALEDAFAAASIHETIAIGDTELQLDLEPNDLTITPDGMEILLAGAAVAEPSECVAAFDPGGSLKTLTSVPGINSAQGAAAVLLSDDFANQALYSLWRGGVLCYTLDDSGSLPLNTAILGLLAGEAFDPFFPTSQPIVMATKPASPPVVSFDGQHDITAEIPALGLDIFAELDGRWARLIGLSLDVVIGIDLNFDNTTGVLGIELFFDPEEIGVDVTFNELAPDANAVILEKFSTVFGSLVEPLIGGLLGENLSFTLGSMEGVGLTQLEAAPAGQGDWLELAAELGPVGYGSCEEGCGGSGGCSGEGGEEGSACSAINGHSRTIWLLPLGLILLLRRRD
jgi:hypothetical protein